MVVAFGPSESTPTASSCSGAPHARPVRHLFPGPSPTVYAGQRLNHRESGGTADAPDLGSGARKGVGVRLSPLAPLLTWGSSHRSFLWIRPECPSCPRLLTE